MGAQLNRLAGATLMSTHNIGFNEDLTKIIFELSSNIIKYAPYFFCCPACLCKILFKETWRDVVLAVNNNGADQIVWDMLADLHLCCLHMLKTGSLMMQRI